MATPPLRRTVCFSQKNPGDAQLGLNVSLAGLARIPFPCSTLCLDLLEVNVPFDVTALGQFSGFFLINLEGETPHELNLGSYRFQYTWKLAIHPIHPLQPTGEFLWHTQSAIHGDDRYRLNIRFVPQLRFSLHYIACDSAGGVLREVAWPLTPAASLCHIEVAIHPVL